MLTALVGCSYDHAPPQHTFPLARRHTSLSDLNIAQAVLTFVASPAGALVAGFAGVWFGMARVKRERGFDQRLAWHKEMLESLHRVAKWIDAVGEAEGDDRIALASDPSLHVKVERFDVLVAEARAYATPSTVAALNRIAKGFDEMNEEPDPDSIEEQQIFLARQIELMRVEVAPEI